MDRMVSGRKHLSVVEQLETRRLFAANPFVVTGGDIASDHASAVTTDPDGNVWVVGRYQEKIDFAAGKAEYKKFDAGKGDMFLAKYGPGGKILWADGLGFGSTSDTGASVIADSDGNIWVAGNFDTKSKKTIYLSKFSNAGKKLATKKIVNATAVGLAFNEDEQIHIVGHFSDEIVLGNIELNAQGAVDTFVAKLSQSASPIWAKSFGGADGTVRGTTLGIDSSGGVLVGGSFSGTVDFDPSASQTIVANPGNGTNAFVVKLSFNGNFDWVAQSTGTGDNTLEDLAVDADDNLVATGQFSGTISAGSIGLQSKKGSVDGYVAKINSDGEFVFARAFGGVKTDAGRSIALDGTGNIHVAGTFQGKADLKPGKGSESFTAVGTTNSFVMKLNGAGKLDFARQLAQKSKGYNQVHDLHVTADNDIVLAGEFTRKTDFNPMAKKRMRESLGATDMFLLQLDEDGQW